tara:strand:- start:278 stop:526 length:249 start_codon:yes stop_codon:yes gene_type:complete
MNKLLTLTTITLLSFNVQAENSSYEYECVYRTPLVDFQPDEIVVIVTGEVESLAELKGKQEIVVEADGEKKTLKVGNCKVEM